MINWRELGLKLAETALREVGEWIRDARRTDVPALPPESHICFRCGRSAVGLKLHAKYSDGSDIQDYAHGPGHGDCPLLEVGNGR